MAIINTYRCDVCGAQKRESNNWWVVMPAAPARALMVFPFQAPQRDDKEAVHCCGIDCLSKAVVRWAGRSSEHSSPLEAA